MSPLLSVQANKLHIINPEDNYFSAAILFIVLFLFMRFCHVTTFYPPYHFGGDAILTQMICEALAHRGHEVDVVYCTDAYRLRGDPVTQQETNPYHIRHHALHSRLGRFSPLITQQTGRPGIKYKKLRKILAAEFDVVHFHNISLIGGPGVLPLSRAAVTLYTPHDHWLFCAAHVLWKNGKRPCDSPQCFTCSIRSGIPPQLWRYTKHTERCLESVDAILAPSQFTADKHHEAGITRPIHVLNSFTNLAPDQSMQGEKTRRPVFVCASRLVKSKGVEQLLQSFVQRPGVDLLIAGEGPLGSALRKQYAAYANIQFLGALSHDRMETLFGQATAVISPSWGPEVFGMTVLESMACGTPVIVRRAGGSVEAIEQTSGGLIYETPEELLPLVDRLVADPELRRSLGEKARKEISSQFSEERWMEQYFDLIRIYRKKSQKSGQI